MATPAAHKEVIHRLFIEVFNGQQHAVVRELYCEDFVGHDPATAQETRGWDGLQQLLDGYRQAFPEHQYELHEVVGEGDFAAFRWSVHALRLKDKEAQIEGLSLCRFCDGRIAEVWQHWDNMGLFKTFGLVPEVDLARALV